MNISLNFFNHQEINVYRRQKYDKNLKSFKNTWIILDNFDCFDLNEFSFPRNWEIFIRSENEIFDCETSIVYENEFQFLSDLLEYNVSRLGIFKSIPHDTHIWNDPYTLVLNNETSKLGQVCRFIHHSMTIESNNFFMSDWKIPVYLKNRRVTYNKHANLILEKSLLWIFPLLRSREIIDPIFNYLSYRSTIRTIDARENTADQNVFEFLKSSFDGTIAEFLLNFNQTHNIQQTLKILFDKNYQWPELGNSYINKFCSPVVWKESGSLQFQDPDCNQIKNNFTVEPPKIKDIFLVIVFNNPLYKAIPYVNNLFYKSFKYFGYCGPNELPEDYKGFFVGYKNYEGYTTGILNGVCSSTFLAMRHKFTKGLLIISDDMILNTHQVRKLPSSNFLITKPNNFMKKSLWKLYSNEITRAIDDLFSSSDVDLIICAKNLNINKSIEYKIFGGFSDVYYVPYKLSKKFIKLNNFFIDRNVTFEIGIPTLMFCSRAVQYFNTEEKSAQNRNKQWQIMHDFPKRLFIHPTKWGMMKKISPDYQLWQHLYCRTKYYINDKLANSETMRYFVTNRKKFPLFY